MAAFRLADPVWTEHHSSPSFAKGQQRPASILQRQGILPGVLRVIIRCPPAATLHHHAVAHVIWPTLAAAEHPFGIIQQIRARLLSPARPGTIALRDRLR